ncbi:MULTISPECIES: flagellar biosynthesis anti-sigma factor FlgM [Anaerotignum]|uniref:flagellar biosynthesis anti-sigma factor FlgM n=1 Tax=Anaerotignum TaxID=2039240 RepID=UPI00210B9239|nr:MULTISPECIES: flagellar biosynthesis anti-sigma factor FlgM [Anaerotignum]MCQ4936062.1 flagellar biosynthesis anti-sigma factor FlgM [Anaerotignum propionicum]
MKVTGNHFFNLQSNAANKDKSTYISSQSPSVSRAKNYDEIIICGKTETPEQNSFVDALKNKISKEVATPTSEEKIADLKQQIEAGTYQIDIDQIAKKMLLS